MSSERAPDVRLQRRAHGVHGPIMPAPRRPLRLGHGRPAHHSRRAASARRSLRLGPLQDPRRATRCAARGAARNPRYVSPPGARQERRGRHPRDARASSTRFPTDTRSSSPTAATTFFWDAAAFGLVASRAQHCAFGEFGAKFAAATAAAPLPRGSQRRRRGAGDHLDARRRGRNRRVRVAPQRDLDRGDGAGRAPRGDRRRARRRRWNVGSRRRRGRRLRRRTCTTSPPRRASPRTAGSGSRSSRPRRSRESSGLPRRGGTFRRPSPFATPSRTRAPTRP